MVFGKPRLTNKEVRCLNCEESYPEHKTILKHAGRTAEGDFWNDKCPECGVFNMMNEENAQMSEEEFQKEKKKIKEYRRG